MAKSSYAQARTSVLSLSLVAALSALVVVGVYEVRARLAKHGLQLPLDTNAPEQSAPVAPAEGSPASVPEGCAGLRRRYLHRCPNEPIAPPPEQQVPSPQTGSGETRMASDFADWLNPRPSELGDMAKRCEVRFEIPAIIGNKPHNVTDEESAAASLSSGERALVQQTLNDMHAELRDFAERALAEASGQSAKTSAMPLEEILTELQTRPESGFEEARQKLAQELAGLSPPPGSDSPQPPGERLLRLLASTGDAFERRLADGLGSDRARQLRSSPYAAWRNRVYYTGCRSQPQSASE